MRSRTKFGDDKLGYAQEAGYEDRYFSVVFGNVKEQIALQFATQTTYARLPT